jgi:hypothetical protein
MFDDQDNPRLAARAPYYEEANVLGRKSVAPCVHFRMHLAASLRGSNRSGAWSGASPTPCRCASSGASPSRNACPLTRRGASPDSGLPLAVHQAVFALILGIVEATRCQGPV